MFVTSATILEKAFGEKTFGQVWLTGLLHKIKNLGIDQNLLRWINSFLNERTMSIKIKNRRNESFTPKYLALQGSPPSPVLSTIYVSDILQPEMADDTAL